MSGYDVIAFIHKNPSLNEFRHNLFRLIRPREEQIDRRHVEQKKKVYKVTDKGEETINIILNAKEKIQSFMTTLL